MDGPRAGPGRCFRARKSVSTRKPHLGEGKILSGTLSVALLGCPVDMTPQRRQLVREELLRSIAWFGLAIVGWPLAISAVQWLDATPSTVFGLPVLTWASLTAGVIGYRLLSGRTCR